MQSQSTEFPLLYGGTLKLLCGAVTPELKRQGKERDFRCNYWCSSMNENQSLMRGFLWGLHQCFIRSMHIMSSACKEPVCNIKKNSIKANYHETVDSKDSYNLVCNLNSRKFIQFNQETNE